MTAWMNFEGIMLNEIIQLQKHKYCMILLKWSIWNSHIHRLRFWNDGFLVLEERRINGNKISFSRGSRWCYDEKITPFRLTFLTLGLLHINKLCNFNRRYMYNTMFIVTKRFCFSPAFLPKTDFKKVHIWQ